MSNYQTQFGNYHFEQLPPTPICCCESASRWPPGNELPGAWSASRRRTAVVRLEGIVPTFYDRQLILAVAQHVAGVLRVEDELAIDEPPSAQTGCDAASSRAGNGRRSLTAARKRSRRRRRTRFTICRCSTNRWKTFWQSVPQEVCGRCLNFLETVFLFSMFGG